MAIKFKMNQPIWLLVNRSYRMNGSHEMIATTISKIGKKWIYTTNGCKIGIDDLKVESCFHGRAYLSEQDMLDSIRKDELINELQKMLSFSWQGGISDKLSVNQLQAAFDALNINNES